MNRYAILSVISALGLPARAASAQPAPPPEQTLTISILDTIEPGPHNASWYERESRVFEDVFKRRNWPLRIRVERFGANSQDDAIQLRVFPKGINALTPGELTYRGWMVLRENGKEHDLGMVTFRYGPRSAEDGDTILDRVEEGAAQVAADKVEKILFPGKPPAASAAPPKG